MSQSTDPTEHFCPECGYDIRHTSQPRCPECGKPFNRDELAVSRIPWVHRARLGRFAAWHRTVWMAMFRPGELGNETARPVDWRSASRFRWINVCAATGILTLTIAILHYFIDQSDLLFEPPYYWDSRTSAWVFPLVALTAGKGQILLIAAGVFAGLAAVSWWLRTWFWAIGEKTRERTTALSCYLTAWMLSPALLAALHMVFGVLLSHFQDDRHTMMTLTLFMGLPLLIGYAAAIITGFISLIFAIRRIARTGIVRACASAIGLPVSAASIFLLVFSAVAYLLGMAALMLASIFI